MQANFEFKKQVKARRELEEALDEKDRIFQEYQKICQELELTQEAYGNVAEIKRLRHENENQLRVNNELRRTIDYLEESSLTAKNAIIDLKEALASKDIDLKELSAS